MYNGGLWNDNGGPYQPTHADTYVVEWEGADVLAAVAANPSTINGGAGADQLYGAAGQDIFVFDNNSDKYTNPDTIHDFSQTQGDTIDISDILFGYGVNAGNIAQYVSITSGSGVRVDTGGTGSFSGAGHTIATFADTIDVGSAAAMLAAGHLIV